MHSQPSPTFVTPSPKPMITFDMAKWDKEIKDVSIKDESFDSVASWYDTIQQAMIIATGKPNIMPELELLTKSFDFAHYVLPQKCVLSFQGRVYSICFYGQSFASSCCESKYNQCVLYYTNCSTRPPQNP